jgi:glycosyltransferase involved in cell wall biosynthesis
VNIWYVGAYDQPRGQSPRTYDFSRELVRRGHDVTMFTNGYCHFTHKERLREDELWRVEMVDGIRVVWLKTHAYVGNGLGRGLNMLDNARRVLRSSRVLGDAPNVVLGPSVPLFTGWAASRLAYRYHVPFVFEVRDVWPDALVDIGGIRKNSLLYRVFRHVEKLMYRKAQRISSTLPNLTEHVTSSGADPSKVVYIPNGVDLAPFSTLKEAYDGGTGRQLLVMYVGGFGLDHDVPTILRAAKILQDEGDERFRFVLIGGGVRKAQCVAEARLYGLHNLEFRDPVPKTCLPELQRHADILVAAITDAQSYRFGLNLNKLCSYFASARPVLFSGNPPNDPVKESGGGLSVKAEDPRAMVSGLRALADKQPSERIRMGECGHLFARTSLSMEVLGARMETMLASAIMDFQRRA